MADTPDRPLQMSEDEIYADMERLEKARMGRREFLKRTALGALGTGLAATGLGRLTRPLFAENTAKPAKSQVFIVRNARIRLPGDAMKVDAGALTETVSAGLCALTGAATLNAAWKQLLKPGERVAVKWNELGGNNIMTRPELKDVVKAGTLTAGITDRDILLWGRLPLGDIPEAARGWSQIYPFPNGMTTQLTNALEQWGTALISLPVLKMHGGTQMSCSLKLHFGSNSNPGTLHGTEQAPMWQNIAYLNALDGIRRKTRLVIADALRPQWADGPGDRPQFRWDENCLLFSTDPVAIDSVGCGILERKRREVGLSPATDARRTLTLAQELGIGNADPANIEVKVITVG